MFGGPGPAPQAPPPPAPPPMIGQQPKPPPAKKPMTPTFLGAEKTPSSDTSFLGSKPGKQLIGQ